MLTCRVNATQRPPVRGGGATASLRCLVTMTVCEGYHNDHRFLTENGSQMSFKTLSSELTCCNPLFKSSRIEIARVCVCACVCVFLEKKAAWFWPVEDTTPSVSCRYDKFLERCVVTDASLSFFLLKSPNRENQVSAVGFSAPSTYEVVSF